MKAVTRCFRSSTRGERGKSMVRPFEAHETQVVPAVAKREPGPIAPALWVPDSRCAASGTTQDQRVEGHRSANSLGRPGRSVAKSRDPGATRRIYGSRIAACLAMLDDALAQAVRDADIKGPRRLLARM